MPSENLKQVRIVARRMSFLMEHQDINPDLKGIVQDLSPPGIPGRDVDRESDEYLLGAYEALIALIMDLEEKGS
jgi:hypothetical protein